ncbi:fructan hydrolase [Streptococcus criceti]|uniref:Fructan beta-fructosidase family protein n=1 Tax=Streptococcus criceti HS-6 TaxID=873449 RepID=G5JPY7_STRCG|nr:GH32 C-terminal domain-containing protein [Streptococcus criceti]EHI74382.1 fructan beta-fructosidase family protein [Streptococcus criceti HS-6]SUN43170.1 fructan hydrolase [Streptococcus criceti]
MKNSPSKETKTHGWYMHKRGKHWVYGCSLITLLVAGLALSSPVLAEETSPATSTPNTQAQAADTAKVEETSEEASTIPADSQAVIESKDDSAEMSGATNPSQPSQPVERASQSADEGGSTANLEASQTEASLPSDSTPIVEKADAGITVEKADVAQVAEKGYQTNLTNLKPTNGTWEVRDDGLYSNALDKGDSWNISDIKADNFVYSTDIKFLKEQGAVGLIFRSTDPNNVQNSYAINIDGGTKKSKFWRWDRGEDQQLIDEKQIEPSADGSYFLRVVAIDSWLSFYINGQLVGSTGDYTLQKDDKGQRTVIKEGYLGLLNWNGEAIFQNTYYTPITDNLNPELADITIMSDKGQVEKKGQFLSNAPVSIQYVDNAASSIKLAIKPKNDKSQITISDSTGKEYQLGDTIPLAVSANYLTVTSTVTTDANQASLTYRINVHRRQAKEVYYNELFRDQYHYSVKDGWGNDPNGLVYYKGKYHLFYQFYDDQVWGPMHWAHATSTDLIHWEEQPIALYPDTNGTMFSGCIVVDEHNSSGFFKDGQGGLVALVTADGNGQRIKLAYSPDEGQTWTKVDQVAADWSDDPLQSKDFRDPKVFHWNNKWFMVLAGGPLRIYSSDNLRDWSVESTYPDIHTECPDFYPIQTEDGTVKWVLSRGGRYYKVGDFKQIDGKWTFSPDQAYKDSDGVMNFGKDSYAAMTYYVQDFGTEANPTIPKLTELNWMNTWDYCNLVAKTVDQDFNGTYNLNLQLGLVKENGTYVLTQTPLETYKTLRDTAKAISYQDVTVTAQNDLLKAVKSDSYEIVATFRSSATTTKVGFKLRQSKDQETLVVYDLKQEELSIDRTKSGVILNDKFAEVNKQKVTTNADGSISLHIFVDRASLEVFAKGDTVTGANQIFPAPDSLGASVFAEGGDAKADINFYPLKSIWTDKVAADKPFKLVGTGQTETRLNLGQSTSFDAYLAPAQAKQDISWQLDKPDLVDFSQSGSKVTLTAKKAGTLTLTASSKENLNLTKTYKISIFENNFKTNLKDLKVISGQWIVDDKELLDSNTSANDAIMSTERLPYSEYKLEADVKYQKGLVNIFFASPATDPANAYAFQLGDQASVRLYYFQGDTIAEQPLNTALNDNHYHHLLINKTKDSVSLSIDGQEVMSHKFASVKDYFNQAYVGLGLWDGAVAFQNVYLTPLNQDAKPQGWFTANQHWYYRKADGQLATGLTSIDGKTHYFNADGSQVKGDFASPDGGKTWYYLDKDNGYVLTGLQTIQGKTYYFNADGSQVKGDFASPDGGQTWYYLDKDNGHVLTGLQTIQGKTYYFNADGSQVKGDFASPDGGQTWYYLDKDNGHVLTGLQTIQGKTYYFNADGSQVKGDFASPDGGQTWYYLDKDNGQVLTGGQTIKGKRYTFDETGKQIKGRFVTPDGGKTWYYLDKDNGLRVTGRQVINGEICYFDQDGRQIK